MNDYGLVSIITPCYNAAKYISDTIESILAQTYSNWELLITDDCSSDNSIEIIEEYVRRDSRIKIQKMEVNGGAGVCRNKSIEEAKGRYIAFCDSDDQWFPEKLEKQLSFMIEKKCALSYTSYMTCNDKGLINGIIVSKNKESFHSMIHNCGIGCLTAIYDTEVVGKVFMPAIRKRQDWGLWLTILKVCKVAYGLKEPLAIYRLHSDSISNNKISLVKYNLNVYRKVLGYSTLKSYLLFTLFFLPSYFTKRIIQAYINR